MFCLPTKREQNTEPWLQEMIYTCNMDQEDELRKKEVQVMGEWRTEEKVGQGKELVLLGYNKVAVLTAAGVDKLEEAVPGARKQIDQVVDFTLQFGQAALVKTQVLARSAMDLALDIVK